MCEIKQEIHGTGTVYRKWEERGSKKGKTKLE